MIFTERTIRIINGLCKIDNPILLYRGDFNVEIRFTIIDCPYKYTAKDASNVIETTNASYGQLVIKTPTGDPIFSDVTSTNEGAIVFTITGDMIDETIELGEYDFQIRLFDAGRTSRATICPVVGGIKVEEPIAIEGGSSVISDTNEVNNARANYAVSTTATALDAFDSQGNYIETTWADKMLITDARLNKIEDGITGVNTKAANAINNIPTRTSQLTNDSDFATNASVDEKIGNIEITGGGGSIGVSYDEVNEELTFVEGTTTSESGLSSTAKSLLISILRNAVFTSDQSESIALLQSELAKGNDGGSSETTQYVISNNLSNATTSNSTVLVNANASYTATITANDGYELLAITVTMNGTDITSSTVSGNTITISAITGNVVITVTTTASGGGSTSGGMVTDGLENFFDFRTATYNNNGSGGSTIISATQGNGSLFTWATDKVTEQGDYGMTVTRAMIYNGTSVGTTTTSLGTSFTVIFKSYLTGPSSPLFDNGYASASNVEKISYKPKYKTSSGTGNVTATMLGARLNSGYETITLMVDGNICKLYFGTTLMQTNDGSTISDFNGWFDQLTGVVALGSTSSCHFAQMAVYNKALSEVELVDMIEYLSSLEVK